MDIITNVEKQKRKYIVTINETHLITVPYSLYQERPLEVNEPLDLVEYENWLMLREFKHGLNRAVAFLALRARSEGEVYNKLIDTGYLPQTAEMVVVKLVSLQLLNDEDFARQWIESRNRSNIGRYKITLELRKKGLSASAIEKAFEEVEDLQEDPEEDTELVKALYQGEKLLTRYQREPNDKKYQKMLHSLVRRGFSWDTAKKAVTQLLKGDAGDEE